jgi:hypothetical protein
VALRSIGSARQANTTVEMINSLRAGTNIKYRFLIGAGAAQVVTILALSVSAISVHRVIDTSWDPPVTVGVRWVSVIADGLQQAGQAAFMRDIAVRR